MRARVYGVVGRTRGWPSGFLVVHTRRMSTKEQVSDDGEWAEPVGMGRAVAMGGLVGVVLAFVVSTLGMLAAGVELGSALGLGLFIGFWGGLGFGVMVGGVVWVSAHEEHPPAV